MLRRLLEILQIEIDRVSGDELLQLRGREHGQPIGIDDGVKPADETRCLRTNLLVHTEHGHPMDVAYS